MSNPHQDHTDLFSKKGAYYWLISKADIPRFARARNDVPVEIVDDLSEEEARLICDKIQSRLARGRFCEIYIRVLMRLNDRSAIDVLKTLHRDLKERKWKTEAALVAEAIRHLESIEDPLAPRKPFRLSDIFRFPKRR